MTKKYRLARSAITSEQAGWLPKKKKKDLAI